MNQLFICFYTFRGRTTGLAYEKQTMNQHMGGSNKWEVLLGFESGMNVFY